MFDDEIFHQKCLKICHIFGTQNLLCEWIFVFQKDMANFEVFYTYISIHFISKKCYYCENIRLFLLRPVIAITGPNMKI